MVYSRTAEGSTASTSSSSAVVKSVSGTVKDVAETSSWTLPTLANRSYTESDLLDSANKFYGWTLTNTEIAGVDVSSATDTSFEGENKMMSFTFWDETEEGTKGQSTQNAVLLIEDFTVDLVDEIAPNAIIHPFHWNSSSDNSLADNSTSNGHIELEDDLPEDKFTTAGTGIYDRDPKVSGKIVLTGYAYDETSLSKIEITETSNQFTLTNCYAEYKNTDGTVAWTSASGTGWTLAVENVRSPDQRGHLVKWTLKLGYRKCY